MLVFLGAVAMIALVGGLFYRSPEFFMPLNNTRSWHFYTLREAGMALEGLSGLLLPYSRVAWVMLPVVGLWCVVRYIRQPQPYVLRLALVALVLTLYNAASIIQRRTGVLPPAAEMVRLVFPALAVYFVLRYIQRPERDTFRTAVLAVMSAMLFGLALHIWPWYLMWVIGLAAIAPTTGLARWAVGVALVSPFPILIWIVLPDLDPAFIFDYPALAIYTVAALWFVLAPQRWFSEVEPGGEQRLILPSAPAWEGEY